MSFEEIKRIIKQGTEEEKTSVRTYFAKYGNTPEKEIEVHEILVSLMQSLSKEEIILLSGTIGYPVFLRICLTPKIRHKFPLLQDGSALVVIDDENRVLVQQRTDNGKFGFSGGCQELGEELKQVGIREGIEETGLEVDDDKVIEVCEVSGLSRKNAYPNGDVVVNNTALYVAHLRDTRGTLQLDFESKSLEFQPISFLRNLSKDQLHDGDFVDILDSLINGKEITVVQPKVEETIFRDRLDGESFADYLASLDTDQSLSLAKKMGYENFLLSAVDERIRDIFPHIVDKSVLIVIDGENILLQESEGQFAIPKCVQSVGDSFENIVEEKYGISSSTLELLLRTSGEKTYDPEKNIFTNAIIFTSKVPILETDLLKYVPITKVQELLNDEDNLYLNEYFSQKETNLSKKKIIVTLNP